ncbi:MAG: DUF1579 family protein [Candidatus Acidiferrales bacterium]
MISANPKAPPELSHFAFLIGKFRCDASLKVDDGSVQNFKGAWEGRYILDGYAIGDEYRMFAPSGELIVLGLNFRAYDPQKKSWNIKWLNGLTGTWVDLGTEELGGVLIEEKGITYRFQEDAASPVQTRAVYADISENHFTWRGEHSSDGKSWQQYMVIECDRAAN